MTQVASAEFVNDVYELMRAYIKANHGWSSEALTQTELYKQYQANMDALKAFDGKRCEIQYLPTGCVTRKVKIGRIKIDDGKVKFYEGGSRTKYQTLDLGLFEGFFAVLVVLQVQAI